MRINNKPVCPCCGVSEKHSRKREDFDKYGRVVQCRKCQAVYTVDGGSVYLGESYKIVLPYFERDPSAQSMDDCIYYDLTCLGSAGISRRHGWYNPTTKRVVQVG